MTDYICKVIAEVGSTWKRDTPEESRQVALDSIRTAKEVGADIVKFQFLTAEGPWSKERALDKWEATRPYWIPPEWLVNLRNLSAHLGIGLWMSFFDVKSVMDYARFCDGLKLASGELTETSRMLLQSMAKQAQHFGIPLAISTGTHTEIEVAQALDWLNPYDIELILMNCVSEYPASPVDYDFDWMWKYGVRHGITLGLSDHTPGSKLITEAMKNRVIYFEKHFRLDDTHQDNPDFVHSLSPANFKEYAQGIRMVEGVRLDIEKSLSPIEEGERAWMQRGSDGKRPRDA